jgi:hypothetical protein
VARIFVARVARAVVVCLKLTIREDDVFEAF